MVVAENEDDYGEYVVEYVDESLLNSTTSTPGSTAPSSPEQKVVFADESAANTEFEDDDRDEDYKPPMTKKKDVGRKLRARGGSVSSVGSGFGAEKKRGRPQKPLRTHLTAKELANLEPEEKKHKELRFKNNEASRLSRFKRRMKDVRLSEQCDLYDRENRELRKILKVNKKLHKELRALIVGIKLG